MVAWVVMDRTHSRQTPPSFFPFRHSYFGSHPSFIPDKFTPFFSRTYVEPILQPLSFDGLPSDAGCTPLLALPPQPPSLDCLFPTPYPYPPFFQSLAHIFALTKNTTPLFSIVSALCVKKHNRRGGGRFTSLHSPQLAFFHPIR